MLSVQRADLKLRAKLLQHCRAVILGELLRSILASNARKDWKSTLVPIINDAPCAWKVRGKRTLLPARVLFLELREVINILVNDNPKVLRVVVRLNIGEREGLRHGGQETQGLTIFEAGLIRTARDRFKGTMERERQEKSGETCGFVSDKVVYR